MYSGHIVCGSEVSIQSAERVDSGEEFHLRSGVLINTGSLRWP